MCASEGRHSWRMRVDVAVRVDVIGVPVDLGAARRGTDMGPSAIRCARLAERLAALGIEVHDVGNVEVPVAESRDGRGAVRFLPEIVDVCRRLSRRVAEALGRGSLPLVLGGDHSLAMGSLAGRHLAGQTGGVIWVDAHADFNTDRTSPSGNVHGMPLAAACGHGAPDLVGVAGGPVVAHTHVVLVGTRSVDLAEATLLRDAGIRVFSMRDIDERGMADVMREALARASAGGSQRVHVSLDMDVLDPTFAPGVGTPVAGGLTYREAQLAMEMLADSGFVGSLDVVEVNPALDERNRTAMVAVDLAASALGERIW